jgi:archaellin
MTGREKIFPIILAAVLVAAFIISAGCTGTETPRVAVPTPTSAIQPGQVLQYFGDVTAQGIMLPGVPRVVIDTITFTIGITPGSRSVDIGNITIIYADAVRTQSLTSIDKLRGEPPKGAWGLMSVANEVGKPNDRLEYGERATIRISPPAAMLPNQLVTIVVKPKDGPSITIRRIIPSAVTQGDNILIAA